MTYAGPDTEDITRAMADRKPDEVFTYPGDLTGHTADLVIELETGTAVTTIAGTVDAGASESTITFELDAASVATAYAAGVARYAVILDRATASARETYVAGSWIVVDYAG